MKNFLVTFFIIVFAVVSLTVSSNLSTLARSTQYLKEDLELAVHDASLQLDNESLSNGIIVFDKDKALEVFKESFELNSKISPNEYKVLEFEVFDHSNSTFPVEYESSEIDFSDIFLYPSIIAIIETNTEQYFFTNDIKPVTRIASYSYKLKNNNPIYDLPIIDLEPNENGFYWAVPHTTNITSGFTPYRLDPFDNEIKAHKGIDIADKDVFNTPVVAISSGTVTYAGVMGGYGNIVEIDHGNGLVSRYAHLNRMNVTEGQFIEGGQVLGTVGSTGRSTGSHLHLETIYNGVHVNPLHFY